MSIVSNQRFQLRLFRVEPAFKDAREVSCFPNLRNANETIIEIGLSSGISKEEVRSRLIVCKINTQSHGDRKLLFNGPFNVFSRIVGSNATENILVLQACF
jgi:hypothetical protein